MIHPLWSKTFEDLTDPIDLNNTILVYRDWLEEHGHKEIADFLAGKFPRPLLAMREWQKFCTAKLSECTFSRLGSSVNCHYICGFAATLSCRAQHYNNEVEKILRTQSLIHVAWISDFRGSGLHNLKVKGFKVNNEGFMCTLTRNHKSPLDEIIEEELRK